LKIRPAGEVTYRAPSCWWTLFPHLLSDAPQCFAGNEKFVAFAFYCDAFINGVVFLCFPLSCYLSMLKLWPKWD